MILLSHPTGNAFVRAILSGLLEADELDSFHTTINCDKGNQFYFHFLNQILSRRHFPVPSDRVIANPEREFVRMLAPKLGLSSLTRHEFGWASLDAVYQDLDRSVSRNLYDRSRNNKASMPTAIYSYEDGCLNSFKAAKHFGLRRFYDLPIAYWQTSRKLLLEEAQRWPEWEPTLYATRDSDAKLERKAQELELAEVVICPSGFVLHSLPESIKDSKSCIVAEFGTTLPTAVGVSLSNRERVDQTKGPLRVLFAGSMGQRKGLADLFAACKTLKRNDIELVVMGSPILPLDFYRKQYDKFKYEQTRSHQAVLSLMRSCHILVLPSIVEGRALVQQEAMACGLPIIVTLNAGGADLIDEGKTGFLVPIRSPDRIAEKINWFADHRDEIAPMGELARDKAMQLTWSGYCQKILSVILPLARGNTFER